MYLLDRVYDDSILWQMSRSERFCFLNLISSISSLASIEDPISALEIGTYCGGSLRHLADFFDKVYSVDISNKYLNPSVKSKKNVEYVVGDSTKIGLAEKLKEVSKDTDLKFILIDGDHEYDAVLSDINNVLTYVPKSDTIVLIHDSWYPPSRQAIVDSNLTRCKHVHFVDTDFCSGELSGSLIVGGLALIIMRPEERTTELTIKQSQDSLFREMRKVFRN
jgi:predicted O-methyltransferase YrrM